MSKYLITLTGNSCAGKSSLENQLVENTTMYKIVSTTTRPQRQGELHGVDYYFVSQEHFNDMVFAEKVNYNGYSYGIEVNELKRAWDNEKTPIVVVEPHGLTQIENLVNEMDEVELIKVFLSVSLDIQLERLFGRFAKDISNANSTTDSLAKIYAKRLTSILETESTWETDNTYDVQVHNYEYALVYDVLEQIEGCMV